MHSPKTIIGSLICSVIAAPAIAENPAAEFEAPTVEVIGTTPVQGIGVPISQVPANVQAVTGKDIEKQRTLDLSEFLDANLGSVSINQGQNNPFQPDVYFRGLTASPLLGTPQGLSVFYDGVRINEPFGDVVNWDLIPQNSISTVNLIPGSNPVFGLNTLGAALSVNTKSGFQYPGGAVSAYGGSWGRKALEAEYGGHGQEWDWFVSGNLFKEDGWREHSPSDVRQFFGKAGRETEADDLDLSVLIADNDLEGTQALPRSWLDTRKQAYTWPDRNENKVEALNLRGSLFVTQDQLIAGNVYYRHYKNTNTSSNVNDVYDGTSQNSCDGTDPDKPCTGINDRSVIDTNGYGASLQYSVLRPLGEMKNSLSAGGTADLGDTDFKQFEQNALFTAERNAAAVGGFQQETHAKSTTRYLGIYLMDNLSISDELHLTLSGRFNRANIKIEDQSGLDPQLNGDHSFSRFNPAIGLNYNPDKTLTTYAAYSEGMRAPTAMELTCADPNNPCKLPNNFLADPPLKKVVSKTLELGARGKMSDALGWSAAAYRTDLNDDIIFVSTTGAGANTGFFQNIAKTRRQGFELGVHGQAAQFRYSANYGYTQSTFETNLAISSPNNSSAVGGDIQVRPGNKVPGIPQHTAKVRLAYEVDQQYSVGTSVVYSGAQYARGDENNQDINGQIPGYTIVHLDGYYQLGPSLQLFFRVQNLFDKKYETFGILGENFFNGPNRTFDESLEAPEQFRSAGAPRAGWIGIKYEFGGRRGTAAAQQDD